MRVFRLLYSYTVHRKIKSVRSYFAHLYQYGYLHAFYLLNVAVNEKNVNSAVVHAVGMLLVKSKEREEKMRKKGNFKNCTHSRLAQYRH